MNLMIWVSSPQQKQIFSKNNCLNISILTFATVVEEREDKYGKCNWDETLNGKILATSIVTERT